MCLVISWAGARLGVCLVRARAARARRVHVAVVGAGGAVGSHVGALLRTCPRVTALSLHDFQDAAHALAAELRAVPAAGSLAAFAGARQLPAAVRGARLVLMLSGAREQPHTPPHQLARDHAPLVRALCEALAAANPGAILGIATCPINVMVPFAAAVLKKLKCLNPCKVFGITGSVEARARALAADVLNVNARHLHVPVIGGHSEESIVPLYSNLKPDFYFLDGRAVTSLTQILRTVGPEKTQSEKFAEYATVSTAWAIFDFAQKFLETFLGSQREVHCFTTNPHFGTKYFASPVTVGQYGLARAPAHFPMTLAERQLLVAAVRSINQDVDAGEAMAA